MRERFFGDSYDIVKLSLVRWLQGFGNWSVHPMFTEPVQPTFISYFEQFLNAQVISSEVLTFTTDRAAYFTCGGSCGNLLLDPNTGICVKSISGRNTPDYLFASELVKLAEQRPKFLTMVFDQSVGRGSEKIHMRTKLQYLLKENIPAFAYHSHACFIIAGSDAALIKNAYNSLIKDSKLPIERFQLAIAS